MGAGGSKTQNTFKSVNDVATEVIVRNMQECGANVVSKQNIDVRGGTGDVTISGANMKQKTTISADCFQDTETSNQIVNEIRNKVRQEAESTSVALLGVLGKAEAKNQTELINKIANTFTNDTLQKCGGTVSKMQGINVIERDGNVVITDVNMEQVTDAVSKCVSQNESRNEMLTTLKNEVAQKAKAKQENPLDFLMTPFIIMAIMAGIALVVFMVVMMAGGEGGPLSMIPGVSLLNEKPWVLIIVVVVIAAVVLGIAFATKDDGDEDDTDQ